jgi:hypothetical protein
MAIHGYHPVGMSLPLSREIDVTGKRTPLRIAATVAAALLVLVLDVLTPVNLAIWLLQIVLVWISTLWSDRLQILCITVVCATGAVLGLCLSPNFRLVSWVEIVNLILALGVIAAISIARARQLTAEEASAEASRELAKSQEAVRILSGLLPICAWCKKIRDESGSWEQLEAYICDRSQAQFTHGVCPDCAARVRRDLEKLSSKS